jgi:dTMP kinase
MKGKVIALEGIDASGKNTQTKTICKWLAGSGVLVRTLSFPNYDNESGKAILAHLKGLWACHSKVTGQLGTKSEYDAIAFQALQLMNRAEEASAISRDLEAGFNMVFDRYWPSGFAYGGSDGIESAMLVDIHSVLPFMDMAIFIDITAEESVRRRPERRDRYEKEPGLQERVRTRYIELFQHLGPLRYPMTKWVVVDGMMSEEAVTKSIKYEIAKFLEKEGLA